MPSPNPRHMIERRFFVLQVPYTNTRPGQPDTCWTVRYRTDTLRVFNTKELAESFLYGWVFSHPNFVAYYDNKYKS
jgi:hypothetical protein